MDINENVFLNNNVKLFCGNALEILKEIPDKSIDLIATDPPYDISATNGGGLLIK